MSMLPISRSDVPSLVRVLALATILVLPFLNQAVHMDDSIYLDIARNALKNPLHPHDFPYCFEGYCAPDMASHSHPPFVAYWLAAWLALSGGSMPEWALHAVFLPFVWLFACSAFLLAKRFSDRPLLYSLIAVSSPVAVVMSHNLMSDYPNMAFWTTALSLYIAGVDHRHSGWIWMSSLFMALSAFTSYPSLVVPLLCWAYAVQRRPSMRAARWAPIVPLVWMGLWLGYSSAYFGRFILGGTGRYFIENRGTWTLGMLTEKFVAFPVFLAGTVALPWNLLGQACRWMSGRIVILGILVSAALAQVFVPGYDLSGKFLFGFLFGVGGFSILTLALGLFTAPACGQLNDDARKDRWFLLLWLGTAACLVLFLYSAASARYLMLLVVPFVILMGGTASPRPPQAVSAGLRWTLASGIFLALGLSLADYQAASAYKGLADELGTKLQGWENKVHFGAEWGLRHYLQKNGFRQFITTGCDFRGADFIIMPEVAIPYKLPQDIASMSFPVFHTSAESAFPIRLMSRKAHAGFFSSGWGLLPFSFSKAPLESLEILQVSMLVEQLPEIRMGGGSDAGRVLPLRGPEGQVDVRLPLPFELFIPHSGPPARVAFEWRQFDSLPAPGSGVAGPGVRPEFRISVRSGSVEQPLTAQPIGDWKRLNGGWASEYYIELPALISGGEIRFAADLPDVSQPRAAFIRNWRILPITISGVLQ
jgi:hypothetical protein